MIQLAFKMALPKGDGSAHLRAAMRVKKREALKKDAEIVRTEAMRLLMTKAEAKAAYRKANPLAMSGRSRPGMLPRTDSGSYRRSIRYKIITSALAVVGPAWPQGAHAGILKWGTKHMKPRLVPSDVALHNVMNRLVTPFGRLF